MKMATVQDHKSKALHNEKFVGSHKLSEGEFADWAVTALFYSALHWMRALAAQEGYQIKRYRKSKGRLGESEEEAFQAVGVFTAQCYQWYRHLKDESQNARYEMRPVSKSDLSDLQQSFFAPFKSFVTSRLRA